MATDDPARQIQPTLATGAPTIGCVSYLNAKPLTEGLEHSSLAAVRFDVPSRLRAMLETGQVDLALCPVIDHYRGRLGLEIVPAGGIGCLGPTLTVRLYSRVPFESIQRVHADQDSHTSVALLCVILARRYHTTPQVTPFTPPKDGWAGSHDQSHTPEAVLLIGDKVVTNHPPRSLYPHQLDLGEAWYNLTGLPFVFAVWMARPGTPLGDMPDTLREVRTRNAHRTDQIAQCYAAKHGWPVDLARQYLGHYMKYEIEKPQLQAIERFAAMAHGLGLISHAHPLRVRSAPKVNPQRVASEGTDPSTSRENTAGRGDTAGKTPEGSRSP